MPETPEQLARQKIDAMLVTSGCVVQDYKAVDFSAGRGIALREVPLKTGPCDYLLLVDRKAVDHPQGVAENPADSGISSGCGDSLNDVPGVSSRPALLNPGLLFGSPPGFTDVGYETGEQLFLSRSLVPKTLIFAEQTRIVAEVERRLSMVEELEAVLSANLQRATRLRQSILQEAFTGALAEPRIFKNQKPALDTEYYEQQTRTPRGLHNFRHTKVYFCKTKRVSPLANGSQNAGKRHSC